MSYKNMLRRWTVRFGMMSAMILCVLAVIVFSMMSAKKVFADGMGDNEADRLAQTQEACPEVIQNADLNQDNESHETVPSEQTRAQDEQADPSQNVDHVGEQDHEQGEDMGTNVDSDYPEEPFPTLKIEDTGRYAGMDRSYHDGYLPSVSGGRVSIVLPLLTESQLSEDGITVTPQLGSTERSPFVYRNYQRTFLLTEQKPLNTSDTLWIYLVRIDLELSPDRYNGIYAVTMNVTGQSQQGVAFSQIFTSYVTIKDGKSIESEPEEENIPEETKPQSQPLLYVSGHAVVPEIPVAGQDFSVTASIRNTSLTRPVRNMAIRVSTDSTELTLLEDSSTVYWERLEADETKALQLRFHVGNNIPVGKYNIMLDMTFDNEQAMTLSASGSVSVTVTQPMELEAVFPDFSSRVNAGDTLSLSFQALNLGKSKAYNVRFELDGAGLIPNGLAYIGNLEAGSAGSADMKVFVGSKDMNRTLEDGVERYGQTSGMLTLIYEDENGNEMREEKAFNTFVEELVIGTVKEEDGHKQTGFQWWVAVIIGALVLAAVCVWLVFIRHKRRRSC